MNVEYIKALDEQILKIEKKSLLSKFIFSLAPLFWGRYFLIKNKSEILEKVNILLQQNLPPEQTKELILKHNQLKKEINLIKWIPVQN